MNRRLFSGSKANRDRRDAAFEKAVKPVPDQSTDHKVPVFLNRVELKIFSHAPINAAKLELLLDAFAGPDYDVSVTWPTKNEDVTAVAESFGCDKDFCK